MSDNNSTSGGVGFWGLLQLAFIVLKLIGKISWSWALVLWPTWVGLCLIVIILLIVVLISINKK